MALIVDPDQLTDGTTDNGSTEVFINTSTKTIKLNTTGNLSTDGVTLKALYSFLKEEWKNDPNTKSLAAFPFPMTPITDESFEFIDGWDMANDASRYLIRTAGWTVRNTSGNVTQQWAGIIGLGNVEVDDQPYFWQGGATTATDFQLTGQINQAIQILSDPNGDGNFVDGYDRRTSLTLYVREQGQLFTQATLSDIGVTSMLPIAYRFPLSTGADLKIVAADTAIKASGTGYPADVSPYSGMSITYYATPQSQTGLVGGSYNFGIVINANGQTLQKAYEFVQYALRQDADINADTPSVITGKIADPLLYYVGDTLYTQAATNQDGGGTGVLITNFNSNDINSVVFVDNTGAERVFPYSATLTLQFNNNLVSDGAAQYWVYFTNDDAGDNLGYDWGTANAIIVQDTTPADMVGTISGSSVTKTYDYDGNTQRGTGSSGVDAPITVIGIGLTTGQYVRASGTIQRSKSNTVALVAPLERNYENP